MLPSVGKGRVEYNYSTVIINLARRAHDHNWELDPITRSLLDTDFYKLLMLQFIWKHFPDTRATFTLINRSHAVRLGDIVGCATSCASNWKRRASCAFTSRS